MLYRLQSKKEGFTLVELIVVIAIMVVLISLLVPNIIGYTERTMQARVSAEAKSIFTAAQNACAMVKADPLMKARPSTLKSVTVDGKTIQAYCITDSTVAGIMSGFDKNSSTGEQMIAYQMCDLLGTAKGSSHFNFKQSTGGGYEPFGENVTSYNDNRGQNGLIVAYNANGVLFVEWGCNGYLARVDSGGNVSGKDGGTFATAS